MSDEILIDDLRMNHNAVLAMRGQCCDSRDETIYSRSIAEIESLRKTAAGWWLYFREADHKRINPDVPFERPEQTPDVVELHLQEIERLQAEHRVMAERLHEIEEVYLDDDGIRWRGNGEPIVNAS